MPRRTVLPPGPLTFGCLAVACVIGLPPTAALAGTPKAFRVQVPSAAAGKQGVAVRLTLPPRPRYGDDGAPVVVVVPGGWTASDLGAADGGLAAASGLVTLHPVFPGGPGSGGTFDHRGP